MPKFTVGQKVRRTDDLWGDNLILTVERYNEGRPGEGIPPQFFSMEAATRRRIPGQDSLEGIRGPWNEEYFEAYIEPANPYIGVPSSLSTATQLRLAYTPMSPTDYLERFRQILDKMLATTTAKNHDYAGLEDAFANFRMVEQMGLATTAVGILTRMTDKLIRVSNLLKREAKVKDEAIGQTLLDLAVYSIILSIYLEHTKGT